MKVKIMLVTMIILTLFGLMQITFGDVVVEKNAVGSLGGVIVIVAVIAIIWVVSLVVIKTVRSKNVGK